MLSEHILVGKDSPCQMSNVQTYVIDVRPEGPERSLGLGPPHPGRAGVRGVFQVQPSIEGDFNDAK